MSECSGENCDHSSHRNGQLKANNSIGEEIDKVVTDKVTSGNDHSTEDIAAQLFFLYFPKFQQGLDTLSKNGLKRLICSLIGHGLDGKEYRHLDSTEKNLVQIGDRLLQAKYVMMLSVVSEKLIDDNKQNSTNNVVDVNNNVDNKKEEEVK